LTAVCFGELFYCSVFELSHMIQTSKCRSAAGKVILPVREDGAGVETLFFVHGWPDDENLWDAQVMHFQDRFKCLRVTMPHFAGRRHAAELKHRPQGYDFTDAAEILANTIREKCGNKRVILVLHDWGCIWGFLVQYKYPELVQTIVAMDVGSPADLSSSWKTAPLAIFVGFWYQYLLVMAYLLSRLSAGSRFESMGRTLADWIVRKMVKLLWPRDRMKTESIEDRITADACYPYFYFQSRLGICGVGDVERARDPTCPCLYFYGTRKPLQFQAGSWLKSLKARSDCKVVAMPAGHWLQVQCAQQVNEIMHTWLTDTSPHEHEATLRKCNSRR